MIQVAATGLCHSDLHYLQRPYPLQGPTVLGHEGAGVVEAVGSDVTYVQPRGPRHHLPHRVLRAVRVVPDRAPDPVRADRSPHGPATNHRACDSPAGSPVCSSSGSATFAEEMLVHEHALVKIDPEIPLDRAAIVGCAVPTGVGAVIRTAKVPPGANVAVVGCGGVGLNCHPGGGDRRRQPDRGRRHQRREAGAGPKVRRHRRDQQRQRRRRGPAL